MYQNADGSVILQSKGTSVSILGELIALDE